MGWTILQAQIIGVNNHRTFFFSHQFTHILYTNLHFTVFLSGGSSKSHQQGCLKTGRESPLPVGPMAPVKPRSEEEEAEFIQPAAEAEKEV